MQSRFPHHPRIRTGAAAPGSRLAALLALLLGAILLPTPVQAQPRLFASVRPDAIRAGEPFLLDVEVRWNGSQDRYVLYPPHLELAASVRQGGVRQYFTASSNETVYHYEYTLTAEAPGPVELGTIKLDYRDMAGDGSSQDPNAGTTGNEPVTEQAPSIVVQPGGVRGALARLLLPATVLAAAILVFALRRRRSRVSAEKTPASPPLETFDALLEEARRHLSSGDNDRVYEVLIKLKPRLPSGEDPLPSLEQLEAERLRARYGGVRGSRDELERLVRAVERLNSTTAAQNLH